MRVDKAFSTIFSLIFALIFLALFIYSLPKQLHLKGHMVWLVQFMMYYLYFICFRTIILLAFSFFEYLSTKTLPNIEYPPLVTIIIPCYNEGKVIKRSIESVQKVNYPNLEILVVDDGSLDDTFEVAASLIERYRVRIVTKANGGKADALNYGISQALGDYVLCMDADSKLDREVINKSIPYFLNDDNLAAVAGSVHVGNTNSLITKFQALEYIIGLNFHKKAQSALNMVTIVPGPVGLFRKNVLIELGGYDSDTFAEDCDLTIKILLAGYNIKYSPDMTAVTEAPDNFYELCVQRYRWARGTIQAITKNINTVFSRKFFKPRNLLIMGYLVVESMLIPSINFVFATMTISFGLYYGQTNLYGPFFLGLILMDATIALYSVLFERQLFSMFFLSLVSRLTYGFSLEVMRFYSMIDEILGIPMKWGVLARKGLEND